MDMGKIIKKQKKVPSKTIEMEPINIYADDTEPLKPKDYKLELDMLLSSAGKKALKGFKEKSYFEQKKTLREISPPEKRQDTRNESLKELDKTQQDLNKLFEREKGSFNPKEEMKKEDSMKKAIEGTEMPEERKKQYLRLLEKRMRTA